MGLLSTGIGRKGVWEKWTSNPVIVDEIDGVTCLVCPLTEEESRYLSIAPSRNIRSPHETFPIEFFNHELRKINPRNDKEVAEFCSKWGTFHSPVGESWNTCLNFVSPTIGGRAQETLLFRALKEAHLSCSTYKEFKECALESLLLDIEKTVGPEQSTANRVFWTQEAEAIADSAYLQFYHADESPLRLIIGMEEVRRALTTLQEIAYFLPAFDRALSLEDIFSDIGIWKIQGNSTYSPALLALAHRNENNRPEELLKNLNIWFEQMTTYFGGFLWPIAKRPLMGANGAKPHLPSTLLAGKPGNLSLFGIQEAICLQLYLEINDSTPWHRCHYSKCGIYFKYQRSNFSDGYLGKEARSDVKYCCRNHSVYATRPNSGLAKAMKETERLNDN